MIISRMVLKRKSVHAVCIDPKKANGPKKPPTKADLQEELRMTKDTLKMKLKFWGQK